MNNNKTYKVSIEDIEKATEIGLQHIYIHRLNLLYKRLELIRYKFIFFIKEKIFKKKLKLIDKLIHILEEEQNSTTLYEYKTYKHGLKSFLQENNNAIKLMKGCSSFEKLKDKCINISSSEADTIYYILSKFPQKEEKLINSTLLEIEKDYFLEKIGY